MSVHICFVHGASLILGIVDRVVLRIVGKIFLFVQSEKLLVVDFENSLVVFFPDLAYNVELPFHSRVLAIKISVKLESVLEIIIIGAFEAHSGGYKTLRLRARP